MFMTTVSFWQDILTTPSMNVSVILRKFYRSIYRREPASSNDGFNLGARLKLTLMKLPQNGIVSFPIRLAIFLARGRALSYETSLGRLSFFGR